MNQKTIIVGLFLISILFLSACSPDNFAGQATRTKTVKTPYQQCTSEKTCSDLYYACLKSDCSSFSQQTQKKEYGACQLSCLTKSIATNKVKIVAPICGDNKKEGTEVCDGADLASQTCISQGGIDGQLGCAANCQVFDTNNCIYGLKTPSVPLCGDNKKEGTEVCDGSDLASQTCISQGGIDGQLGCAANCQSFNTNNCVYALKNHSGSTCGNLKREYGEVCDGSDTGIENCESQNAGSGILGCKSDCKQFDFVGCKK